MKGKIALAALLIAIVTLIRQQTASDEFDRWIKEHGRTYEGSEYIYRREIFYRNMKIVKEHNQEHERGLTSFTMAINKYADLSDEEYKMLFLNLRRRSNLRITHSCNGTIPDTPNPPYQLDWSLKTATEVQNEGSCGASWAFSATGALEAYYAFTRGRIVKFSDQQLLDCSRDYGNNGCDGGFMDQAFWYVIDNGMTTAEQYPYVGKTNKCIYKSTMKVFTTEKCAEVMPYNYSKLLSAVVQQPVSVAVDATNFRFYNDGVYDRYCGTDINRGMLLVGYGNSNGKDFWNLKNSQGADWGRSGYMLLVRNKTNDAGPCGIQLASFVPQGVIV